jgi:hypothetical protein
MSGGIAIYVGDDGMARTEDGHIEYLRESMSDEKRLKLATKLANELAYLGTRDVTVTIKGVGQITVTAKDAML